MTATPLPRHTSARTPEITEADLRHLTRLRWAVRAVLALGVAASIAANVLHARPNLISQVIAAWPPLALLLTVELISRVPADRRGLAAARLIAAAVIAGIAAWWGRVRARCRPFGPVVSLTRPPEPDVRVSAHPALHEHMPSGQVLVVAAG
ncbi:hypothetical protein O7618_21900 [Micromonospora sp. WMMD980]|nr:hypothetical protein [Micromonospora sp. WMMD980]MDG4803169.1 hypothetical protein [Micromonospora sp. WMMD980]